MTDGELQQALLERSEREPTAPKPKESFGTRIFYAALVVAVIVACGLALANFLAPLVVPQDVVIDSSAPLPTAVLPQQQYQQLPAAPPAQQQVAPAQPVPQPPVAAPVVVEQPQPVAVPQPAPVEAPLPEPVDPQFDASFQYQADAANNPFVGCLPGRDCNPSYSQPTALPGPNEPGFRESFK